MTFVPTDHTAGSPASLLLAATYLNRPSPRVRPAHESLDPACYLAGYVHEARRKNRRHLYWGSLTIVTPVIVAVGALAFMGP
jgi:hypothetical protein